MLTYLQVTNFTLVQAQELNLGPGLTVMTGETGAGKSILLDALGLAVGARADASKVRKTASQAEVHACFDVQQLAKARRWLAEADLGDEECIVRRIVTSEGRSRALVNGRPVTQAQLKALGRHLLDIHSQHEHQALLSSQTHRRLLDGFGQHAHLVEQVRLHHKQLDAIEQRLEHVRLHSEDINARHQLLSYQAQELNDLSLQVDELDELEQKQKQLANAEAVQATCQQSAEACIGLEQSIGSQLHKVITLLSKLPYLSANVGSARAMLQEARIQVEEAGRELELEAQAQFDPYELPAVEARLSAIYEVARKHRTSAELIPSLHKEVQKELAELQSSEDELASLEDARENALQAYLKAAEALSSARLKSAKRLASEVNQRLQSLAMPQATLQVSLSPLETPAANGMDAVEFLISTVPGQAPAALAKVASGGELSRISLAIAVVTARSSVVPTLIFDEVDVGIGGATGDVVGRMLRELGKSAQILCVTHLAQVASKADHHYTVEKVVNKKSAATLVRHLNEEDRVLEIARMMGGLIESEQSLAHAREMLATATDA